MTIVEIHGKNYTLNFGFGFLKRLDMLKDVDNLDGTSAGKAKTVFMQFLLGDPFALRDVLKAALHAEKITDKQIDEYLENEADIEELTAFLSENLAKANLTKKLFHALKETMEVAKNGASEEDIQKVVMKSFS